MAVSLQATLAHNPDIAVSSVIGSSIFNILVTLGLSALIIPLRVSRQLVRLDIPLMIGASLLVFVLAWNEEIGPLRRRPAAGGNGAVPGLCCCASRGTRPVRIRNSREAAAGPWISSLLMIVVGLAMLVFAGHLLLGAAVAVATDLGFSERVIGLTVVAVGTSLPELATSLIAALRGQREIAVGNVIGTNLFNLLGVLGFTALIAPTPLSVSPNALDFDLPVMLGVAALCLPVFYSGYRVTRAEGLLLLGLYMAYGLHVVSFTTGMPLAGKLEHLMLFYVLPPLVAFLLFTSLRAWRRQHHKRDCHDQNKKSGVEVRRQVMGDASLTEHWATPPSSPAAAGFRQRTCVGQRLES